VTPHQKAVLWRNEGLLYLGEGVTDDSPIAISAETLAVSHVHMIGPIGSGKTVGMCQIAEPLLLDPDASVVGIDLKPGGGDVFHKLRDFCFAYGLTDRLDLLDFSNEQMVTGFAPMMPNGLIPTAHAKKIRSQFRAGVGQSSFDDTRQLSKFMFIGLYASRLLEMDLVEAWEILLPGSPLRRRILPRIPDPFLKRELLYLESLFPARQDQLLSSSIALLEGVIGDSYIRPFLTHRPSLNIKHSLQQRRHVLINLGHDAPLSIDDVRILGRMIVNEVVTSVFANQGKYGPTYLILDECHLSLSRDISLALDTGRQHGLRSFLIHQYLGQLVEEDGSHLLFDSVMSSGRIKLIFGGLSTAGLEILENETRFGEIDIYKRKHTLFSLETHQWESTREVVTDGESYQYMRGMSWPTAITDTVSASTSHGTQRSITDSDQDSEGESFGEAEHEMDSVAYGTARGRTRSVTDSTTTSDAASWNKSRSNGSNWQDTENETATWNDGKNSGSGEQQSLGYTLPADEDDDPELAKVFHYSTGTNSQQSTSSNVGGARGRTHGAGGNHSQTDGVGGTHATSNGHALSTGESEVDSETHGNTTGNTKSHTVQRAHITGRAVQHGENEQVTNGLSRAVQHGETPSESETWGVNRSVSIVPFYEIEQRLRVSNIEYVSREEQAILHIQEMKYQQIAECMLSVPMNPEAAFFRFDWRTPLWISDELQEAEHAVVYDKPCHSPRAQHEEIIDVQAREVRKPKQVAAIHSPVPVEVPTDSDPETEKALWDRWHQMSSGRKHRQEK
jgi:hypothetical protein